MGGLNHDQGTPLVLVIGQTALAERTGETIVLPISHVEPPWAYPLTWQKWGVPAECYHDGISCRQSGTMIRTQVQLTDQQVAELRRLAARSGVSVAELVRRGVEPLLHGGPDAVDERYRRAAGVVGRFQSGRRDVAAEHDAELDAAYRA